MFHHKKIGVIIAALFLAIFVFVRCINNQDNEDVRGASYAGSQTCAKCHQDIYNHYLLSAHENTSKTASATSISGNFSPPLNVFAYNDSEKIFMRKTGNDFYQAEYINGKEKKSEHIDIVVGSGRKAQTYLYNKDDKIYELPVSYFLSIGAWANSPGYPPEHPYFDRDIPSGCFGCHGSAANVTFESPGSLRVTEKYTPGQLMLGIDCERCHGAAKEHVEYQSAHPEEKKAKFITTISQLTRTQQTDMCAICHSGVKQPIKPIFSFKPGDQLSSFYYPNALHPEAATLDVHGTQTQSIMASQCFIKSNTLTCTSCHDPHQKERENIVLFSQRCMTCHMEANHNFCTTTAVSRETIKANCIDCHMPARPSRVIQMLANANGKQNLQPDFIRTHIVAVYPDESKKVAASWKKEELKQ